MSYPNLSVTGKPSPRTMHPASAGKKRTPLTDNRDRNQKSSIFGYQNAEENPKKKENYKHNPKPTTIHGSSLTKESHSVVTKSKLEEIQDLTRRNIDDKRNIQVAAYRSPRKAAPDGVPTLSLDDVVGKDNDMSYAKAPTGVPKIHTPDSKDTFSWGTPLKQQSPKAVKGGGWQVNQTRKAKSSTRRKHDDVPFLDLKLSQSNEALGQLRQAAKEVREDVRIEYLGASKLIENSPQKGKNKKQDFIEEAILQDQAMRMKITEERPKTSTPQFGTHNPFDPRSKRHEALFNTKSMVTGIQDDLSKRFGFSARILSLNGHDAQRQLNGFFFISDDTITMYEFRQFGTRANALPFIQRGCYSHISGHRKNKPYCILDIATGKNVTLYTSDQPSLPERLKQKRTIVFRITETDNEEARKKLLYLHCKTSKQKQEVDTFIKTYEEEEERNPAMATLTQIQGSVRKSLESRGTKTMTTLFHHFQTIDKSGDRLLNKEEIRSALQKFRIQISDREFDLVWNLLDSNGDGGLDYGEFARGFFGEMNETRKGWVRKAFGRLDSNNSGVGDANNLYKFFCPSKHPDVIIGKMTEESFFEYLQDVFQISKRKKEIPYQIFEAYYESVSLSIKTDEDFVKLMKSTWSI